MARIRIATEPDARALSELYAPYVLDTAISLELEPPDEEAMRTRVAGTLPRLPWLVCEHRGELLGFASAAPYRTRGGYRWAVEVSAYVQRRAHRVGIGRALYGALFELLRALGYRTALAGITLPNPASVGLHETLGFRTAGVLREVGYKLGRWHDVGWWQLDLVAPVEGERPEEPASFRTLADTPVCTSILRRAATILRIG